MPIPTPDEVLQLGLAFAGCDVEAQARLKYETRKERFIAMYGVPPECWSQVSTDIRDLLPAARLPPFKYLLVTAHWLKCQPSYPVLAMRFSLSERTVREWVWKVVKTIASLKDYKIVWGNFGPNGVDYLISVDGVHFHIKEPRREPSSGWYSHKFHGPGLAYELAVSVHVDQLAWIRGPFPASRHDLTIFRDEGGLEAMIPEGKLAIGDSGYAGSPKVSVINENDSPELLEFKNRARARQENFNERVKRFNILSETFRYHHSKHRVVVEAICVLTQIDIETGRKLNDNL